MTTSKNIGLHLNGTSDKDLDLTFLEYRQLINGDGDNSNANILDRAIGSLMQAMRTVQQTVSRCVKTINKKPIDSGGDIQLSASDVGASPSDHTHPQLVNIDQDVKTTASPTFNEVTATTVRADKVIGAVYQ